MALPKDIQAQLAQHDFEAIEETWLQRLENDSTDIRGLIEIAQAVNKEDSNTARFLVEMLDDQVRAAGSWLDRLTLLRGCGPLVVDQDEMHAEILETLEQAYGERSSFAPMLEKLGLKRAADDIPKTWTKVTRLRTLLAFDIGTIVYLKDKGAGRILEANMALDSFSVQLENVGTLRVGFAAAAKMLEPLEPDHILRRKLEAPEVLIALVTDDPPRLLRLTLSSYDRARTGAEIRRDLSGIVPEKRWNSWWTQARKHPQVVAGTKGRQTYRWVASSEDATSVVWKAFEAAEPRQRVDLLRRDGSRDPDLRGRMSEALANQAKAAVEKDPGLACEIWFNLDKHGTVAEGVPWTAKKLIADASDVRALVRGIDERIWREHAYSLIRQKREGWPAELASIVRQEPEARALDRLATLLSDGAETELLAEVKLLLSQPRKAPAGFTWLAERAAERDEWRQIAPLSLLQQILRAITDDTAFSKFRARLNDLIDSGGTIPRLIPDLTEEQAAQAADTIGKTTALQDYQREPLLNAIYLKFPSLRVEDSQPLYATPEAISAKRLELKTLLNEEIPANRKAIEEAREMGDLRENFEYKSARQRHEYLASRAAALDGDLERARPIDPTAVTRNEVVIGCRVAMSSNDGTTRTITILGPWNSEPEKDIVSNESEFAQSLLGLKKGDAVSIAEIPFTIDSIEPFR